MQTKILKAIVILKALLGLKEPRILLILILLLESMWSAYHQTNKLRINHYWTREGDYFYHQKIQRHKKWRGDPHPLIIPDFIKSMNVEKDTTILRFVPILKNVMFLAQLKSNLNTD